jgi:hypothetical protein
VTDDPQVTRLVGADMATCATKDGPVSIVVNRSVKYFPFKFIGVYWANFTGYILFSANYLFSSREPNVFKQEI